MQRDQVAKRQEQPGEAKKSQEDQRGRNLRQAQHLIHLQGGLESGRQLRQRLVGGHGGPFQTAICLGSTYRVESAGMPLLFAVIGPVWGYI